MTHITGPRKKVVADLMIGFLAIIKANEATITEWMEAMHELSVGTVKGLLDKGGYERDCPTCPKPKRKRKRAK